MSDHHGHTRVGLTVGTGKNVHLAEGCSHAPCSNAVCGVSIERGWVTENDGPSLCTPCINTIAGVPVVPVAPRSILDRLGIHDEEDPLALTLEGLVKEHVPELDAEALGALGAVQGRFTSSQVHLDPSCSQSRSEPEESIPYHMDQGQMTVPGWDLHCRSGLSPEAENTAVSHLTLLQAKETLEQMAAEGGWGAYRTALSIMDGRVLGLPTTLTPATDATPRAGKLRQANDDIQRAWSLILRAIDQWSASFGVGFEANAVALLHEIMGGRETGLGGPLEGVAFIGPELTAFASLDGDGLPADDATITRNTNRIVESLGSQVEVDEDLLPTLYQDVVDYSRTLRRSARAFGEFLIQGEITGALVQVPDDSTGWHRDLMMQWSYGQRPGEPMGAWIPGMLSILLSHDVRNNVNAQRSVPLVPYSTGETYFISEGPPKSTLLNGLH